MGVTSPKATARRWKPSWPTSAAPGMLHKAVRQLQEEAPMSAEQLRQFMKQGLGVREVPRLSRMRWLMRVMTTSWR